MIYLGTFKRTFAGDDLIKAASKQFNENFYISQLIFYLNTFFCIFYRFAIHVLIPRQRQV